MCESADIRCSRPMVTSVSSATGASLSRGNGMASSIPWHYAASMSDYVRPPILASAVRSLEVRRETPSIHTAEAVLHVPLQGVDHLSGHALGVLFGEEEDERRRARERPGRFAGECPLAPGCVDAPSPVRPSRCCAYAPAG